jgi:hypothetical protein
MTFTSHGRHYEIDRFGVIVQTDPRPYTYDAAYSSTYDTEAYRRESEKLQALRLGFVIGACGGVPDSLLDVGYGNGAFMLFAKQVIPDVMGSDITGVDVPGCKIVDGMPPADAITFWDVLEHFPNVDFLADLPHEVLCVSLPYCHFHTEGPEWFAEKYKHRKPDEHIRHFDDQSLVSMMRHYGWQVTAISSHEDIVRKSTHGLQNILTMAFKRRIGW